MHDEFIEQARRRARRRWSPGDPLDPKTRLGALVSQKQLETVLRYVEVGRSEGAALVAGGEAATSDGKGYFMQPTIFDGVTHEMTIAREEIFGPVLAVIEFADVDEAIALANDSIYGLAAGGLDARHREGALRRPPAPGRHGLDQHYNLYDTAAPFGGYKQSGFGREMGTHALEHYTQVKTVYVGKVTRS